MRNELVEDFLQAFNNSGFSKTVEVIDVYDVFKISLRNPTGIKRKKNRFVKRIIGINVYDFYNSAFKDTDLDKKIALTKNMYLSSRYPLSQTVQLAKRILDRMIMIMNNDKKYSQSILKSLGKNATIAIVSDKDTSDWDSFSSSVFRYRLVIYFTESIEVVSSFSSVYILRNTIRKIFRIAKRLVVKEDRKILKFLNNGYPFNIRVELGTDPNQYKERRKDESQK